MIGALYRRFRTFWNYAIVGGLTMLMTLGLFYLLTWTLLDPHDPLQLQAANVISWVLAMAFCYIASRKFVFKSRVKNIPLEAGKFYLSRMATLGLEMFLMHVMVGNWHMNPNGAKPVAQVIVILANYVLNVFVVFRRKKEKKVKLEKQMEKDGLA